MEDNRKKCPYCGSVLDEKSNLYKGYYVCTSCGNAVNESKNAEVIRRFSHYIRNLDFKKASELRKDVLDEVVLDVNELQLFTFYSSILDLFMKKEPSRIVKFLNDTTATDTGVVIEVLNFLSSLSEHIQKLGGYILKYVSMQEKYIEDSEHPELNRTIIEVKKHYFKSILNKSAFIKESYNKKQMSLKEILELVTTKDQTNIACLYAIFDEVKEANYTAEEINQYLQVCDHALELYYEKTKKKLSGNYKEYYKKSKTLRKQYHLKNDERYKWQKKLRNKLRNQVSLTAVLLFAVVLIGLATLL